MTGNALELSNKLHDVLSHPSHETFFLRGYFAAPLHPEDRHVFPFTILSLCMEVVLSLRQDSTPSGV